MTVRGKRHRTAHEMLLDRCAADPDEPFLTVVGQPLTPAGLLEESAALAGYLADSGLQEGDRLAVFTDNCAEAVVALFATLRCGIVSVPINSAYKGDFLRHVLDDSRARVLICGHGLLPRVVDLLEDDWSTTLESVVVIDDGSPPGDLGALDGHGLPHRPWEEAMAATPAPARLGESRGPAICLYTGGTTGPSKGCLLSENVLVHHAVETQASYRRGSEDVLWTPLPLFHLNAIKFGVMGTLEIGGKAVISDRFSVSKFWHQIAENRATIANLLGSMATLVARSELDAVANDLRLMVAVPMSDETRRTLVERFSIDTFSGMYGMTECSSIGLLPLGAEHREGSAGKVNAADYDVRILDEDGYEQEAGVPGEIVTRPKRRNIMFSGYLNRPEATLSVLEDLWFHTGDIGCIDEDDYLYFIDRKGDYIRRRGENISTQEIEGIILRHPDVADVAVHAVPSDIAEDDLKVTVVVRGSGVEPASLFRWLEPRVPFFALPAYIELRDELPRSPVGRVLKRELRDEGVTDATWSSAELMKAVVRR